REPARRHHVAVDAALPIGQRHPVRYFEAPVPAALVDRRDQREAGDAHAWNRAHCVDGPLQNCCSLVGLDRRPLHVAPHHQRPIGRVASRVNVRMKRPAHTTSTTDSATWATTSAAAALMRRSPAIPRLPSLIASMGATFDVRNAGASPKRNAVAIVTPAVNPSTRQSSGRSRNTVFVRVESAWTSRGLLQRATARPAIAPKAASTTLSVSSWRARRQRDAPSASRTLISCRRAVARAGSRLAMFPHASSSTSATTTRSVRTGRSYRRGGSGLPVAAPTTTYGSFKYVSAANAGASASSVAARMAGCAARSAAVALSIDSAGFSRTITESHHHQPSSSADR